MCPQTSITVCGTVRRKAPRLAPSTLIKATLARTTSSVDVAARTHPRVTASGDPHPLSRSSDARPSGASPRPSGSPPPWANGFDRSWTEGNETRTETRGDLCLIADAWPPGRRRVIGYERPGLCVVVDLSAEFGTKRSQFGLVAYCSPPFTTVAPVRAAGRIRPRRSSRPSISMV